MPIGHGGSASIGILKIVPQRNRIVFKETLNPS